MESFKRKMTDRQHPFPCIPATIGFSTNQLRYGFAGDPADHSTIQDVAALLSAYTKQSTTNGRYTSLIIFFQSSDKPELSPSVENFEKLFWNLLERLSKYDEREWPTDIPTDPHDPVWEYCFQGERYFMFCGTPAHKNRVSRQFDSFMLAITPRWVLEQFNASPKHAAKIKQQVRKRINDYDLLSVHPALNSYGESDNFEWKQYFLRDDDSSIQQCPFHR
ncbi:YqcI/YcgG family protein [Gracilibacillus salinarum]|uniref:YqcI/YcgG family protein n=1 Tax=Gracilibacillus salinarum TaxID=2932255 RepID=A0ABY4GP84_9BACI|nr:YqcI/YcgG family protein [Gracilibacillus salinarum]UOQ86079.1 YqcI/YcgG family protein [Gracilibacillus salinarum]